MTAPSKMVRNWTYLRDNSQCQDCGTLEGLSWQHREASGNGGRGKKAPALRTSDGITLCVLCNESCEAEGQERALALGWKIRRNRGGIPAWNIPFFDRNLRCWYLPTAAVQDGPWRVEIDAIHAADLLGLAGNLSIKGVSR